MGTAWFETCFWLLGFCDNMTPFSPGSLYFLCSLCFERTSLGRNRRSEAAMGVGVCAPPGGTGAVGRGSYWTRGRAGGLWLGFSLQVVWALRSVDS